MSIKKKYLKSRPVCKVTFKVPKEIADNAKSFHVVGEFNDWDERATPMTNQKNGAFSVTVDLDLDREYQFRYVRDDKIWENDDDADRYEHTSFGNCENSVIVTKK